jgi:hypothetical protein
MVSVDKSLPGVCSVKSRTVDWGEWAGRMLADKNTEKEKSLRKGRHMLCCAWIRIKDVYPP